jgi:DNA invertase Pin-like site-specific DNA recombinase
VAELFEPPSTSGYKKRGLERPRWPELLEMIRSGAANVVVIYKTDRLSRGGGPGWAPLQEAAEAAGLDPDRFVLVVGSGFMSEFEIGIRATMDREEAKKMAERSKDLHERLASEGRFKGGARPFGYGPDGVTVVESEAALITEAAERVLAGDSLTSTVRSWNAAGIKTAQGRDWRVSGLRVTLISGRVAGRREVDVAAEKEGKGKREDVGPAEWPAILDRQTWERVRAILTDPARKMTTRGRRHLLTGLLRCGYCGGRMSVGPDAKGVSRYKCHPAPGTNNCGRLSVAATPTEAAVVEMVLDVLETPGLAAAMNSKKGKKKKDPNGAERALADAEARLVELAEMFGAGELDRASFLAARRKAEAVRDAARATVTKDRRDTVLEGLDTTTIRKLWPELPEERQRAIMTSVLDRIEVGPVKLRGPRFDVERLHPVWRV